MNLSQLTRLTLTTDHNGRTVMPFSTSRAGSSPSILDRWDLGAEKVAAVRLGHVHAKVRSLDRSVPFYTEVLGLRLTERTRRYAFLSVGSEHHSLALEEVGAWAVEPRRRAVGIAHFAFEVPDRAAFAAMRRKLSKASVPFISRNNGISWALRFKDPDGTEIEVYVDRRRSSGGATRWSGRWRRPPHENEAAPYLRAAA
jgi:catechol 2,3-dioxygenase